MGFRSIRFEGFRNLEDREINLDAHSVYFVGENGQGKTSILEVLYYLAYGASFRTRQDRDVITWNHRRMKISGMFDNLGEPEWQISVTLEDGDKSIRLHDKIIEDRKYLLHRIPVIVFLHNDFLFASGPPERRRWFMDQTLSLHNPIFVDEMRRFQWLLKERNHLLKMRRLDMLDHYDEMAATAGLTVVERRTMLTEKLGMIFTPLFRDVSGMDEEIKITYQPSWGEVTAVDEVMEKFMEKRDTDVSLGVTTQGPHRDRFLFTSGGRNFAKTASTGQCRLLSLVLRVAQAQFYAETTGRKPILILDDVLLELDPKRRRLFRDTLPEADQVFYTFLPGEETGSVGENSITYEVEKGVLSEKK